MKKMFFTLLMSSILISATAQKVIVTNYVEKDTKGYSVTLISEKDRVNNFISQYFKETGKVRLRDEIYTISALSRADFPFPEITIFSKTKTVNGETKAIVWLPDSLNADEKYSIKLKELWHTFGLDFYRILAQEEIDKTSRALRYAEKQFQRLEKGSLKLKNNLVKNKEEKIKLEEALKTNALNHDILLQKIANNKEAKDSVLMAIEKIRKLVEVQEEKKRAIQ